MIKHLAFIISMIIVSLAAIIFFFSRKSTSCKHVTFSSKTSKPKLYGWWYYNYGVSAYCKAPPGDFHNTTNGNGKIEYCSDMSAYLDAIKNNGGDANAKENTNFYLGNGFVEPINQYECEQKGLTGWRGIEKSIDNGAKYNIINIGGWGYCGNVAERSEGRTAYCKAYPDCNGGPGNGPGCVWTVDDVNNLPSGKELVGKYSGISLDIEAVDPYIQTDSTTWTAFEHALLEKLADYKENGIYSILTLPGFGVQAFENYPNSNVIVSGRSTSDSINGMKWFTPKIVENVDYLCLMFYNTNNDSYKDELPPKDSLLGKELSANGNYPTNFAETLKYIWSGDESIYKVSADQIILGLSIASESATSRCSNTYNTCTSDADCNQSCLSKRENTCVTYANDQKGKPGIEKFLNEDSLKYASGGVSVWARVGAKPLWTLKWNTAKQQCMIPPPSTPKTTHVATHPSSMKTTHVATHPSSMKTTHVATHPSSMKTTHVATHPSSMKTTHVATHPSNMKTIL